MKKIHSKAMQKLADEKMKDSLWLSSILRLYLFVGILVQHKKKDFFPAVAGQNDNITGSVISTEGRNLNQFVGHKRKRLFGFRREALFIWGEMSFVNN